MEERIKGRKNFPTDEVDPVNFIPDEDVKSMVKNIENVAPGTLVQYKATLKKGGTEVDGQTIFYPDSLGEGRGNWEFFTTDANGAGHFPVSGFSTSTEDMVIPIAMTFETAGEYSFEVEIISVPGGVTLVSSEPKIFTVESSYDFGDAPSPYPTLLADDGARHLTNFLYLYEKSGDDWDIVSSRFHNAVIRR